MSTIKTVTLSPQVAAVCEGAGQRVHPRAKTVATIMAGPLTVLFGYGTGSEVMTRIAAPMVGGMVSAPPLSRFVIPAAWRLLIRRRLRQRTGLATSSKKAPTAAARSSSDNGDCRNGRESQHAGQGKRAH